MFTPLGLRAPVGLLGWLLLALACSNEKPSEPTAPGMLAAKPPAGPKVTATNPSTGTQGQRLAVSVLGSGFNSTAVASWERNGASDPGVTIHSTAYVSSTEVIADITIAEDAEIALYDVAVEVLVDGTRKKGVGVEKFEVLSGAPSNQPANATVTATGFVLTDGPQLSNVIEGLTIRMTRAIIGGNQPAPFNASLGFVNTVAAWANAVRLGQAPCSYTKGGRSAGDEAGTADDDRRAALFAKLTDPAFLHRFAWDFNVYTPALEASSAEHSWHVHWNNPAGDSLFTLRSTENPQIPGDPTVNLIGPNTYRFSGGTLRIIDRTGRSKNHIAIICPNLDEAVASWTPYSP